jgi:DNA-binding transcriptional regulator YiaG
MPDAAAVNAQSRIGDLILEAFDRYEKESSATRKRNAPRLLRTSPEGRRPETGLVEATPREDVTMLPAHDSMSNAEAARRNEPLTESEAAACLGLKVATLRAWRYQARGPAFVRLGRAIRYLRTDLEQFLAANRHRPNATAE